MTHALVVDNDVDAATKLRHLLADAACTVAVAHTLFDARRQMVLHQPDVVLIEDRLPDGHGTDLAADAQLVAQSAVVLIVAEQTACPGADYLVKPIDRPQLQAVLARVAKPAQLKAEAVVATQAQDGRFGALWGRSPAMQRVYEQISRVAATGITVFITGESGSGKELAAQTVHALSRRRKKPWLAVNCGAISPSLIESELFGHEKGSFTGADRTREGFFERAHGGTLLLDEVTEMPLDLQVKLLRVLETGRFMRVGSTHSQQADVRIIAATNRMPEQAVADGKLREDLMYRLNVFPIHLPPLRERPSDVPLLAEHFLAEIGREEGQVKRLSAAAMERLQACRWPGNVRDLRNAIQRAYVMAAGETIDEQWLPSASPVPPRPGAASAAEAAPPDSGEHITIPIGTSMADAERALILATYEQCGQHKEKAALRLGISLKTLYNRLKEYQSAGDVCEPARCGP